MSGRLATAAAIAKGAAACAAGGSEREALRIAMEFDTAPCAWSAACSVRETSTGALIRSHPR